MMKRNVPYTCRHIEDSTSQFLENNHEEYHVNHAIVIGVILRKVYLIVNGIEGSLENLSRLVVAFKARVIEVYWSHYVKLWVELPH